jgi:hypothetical protein
MPYVCPLCEVVPSSHSLTNVLETNEIVYYYTCPSKAILYHDVNGIIHHYNGVLSEIPENKEWVWIFDGLNFGFIHVIQTSVAIELAKLITQKFSKNLKKIIVINPTFYVNMIHELLMPFLNKKIKNIIEFRDTSISLEKIMEMIHSQDQS